MTAATRARAEFLKAQERTETSVSTALQTRWGTAAGDTSQSSALVNQSDAAVEAARQLALMSNALAEDGVTLEGVFFDLEGEAITVSYSMPAGGNYFGGAASVTLLVTRSRPSLAEGITTINGLIQL